MQGKIGIRKWAIEERNAFKLSVRDKIGKYEGMKEN